MNTPNFYELEARYDSRKSFYGKAHIIDHGNNHFELQSYDTIVAEINNGVVVWDALGEYSQTTNRHIREFIKQFT